MEALIHGAAGFVADSLVSRLVTEGLTGCTLVDRNPVPARMVDVLGQYGVRTTVLRGDALCELPVRDDVDVVFVLAGQTDVDEALAHPARAFEANTRIAIDCGEWLRRRSGTRAVYVSTDEVLGESSVPLSEDAPVRPTQPYAASKAASETILSSYQDTYGIPLVTIRSCNLVGRAQRARKLLPTAVTRLSSGQSVPVFGSGSHLREWMSVEDLCEALVLAADRRLPAGLYHCSSGWHLSVLETVQVIADAIGVPAVWEHVADRLVHDHVYAMDSSRLRSYGWSPRHDPIYSIQHAAKEMRMALDKGESLLPS